jgi:hypothetical protein
LLASRENNLNEIVVGKFNYALLQLYEIIVGSYLPVMFCMLLVLRSLAETSSDF